jgi:putative ABC transport system permease protein
VTLRSWVALAVRESRGSAGRLAFFAACLSVGVAAVVAVAGLSQALDSAIQGQARQLLAADLTINSRRDIPSQVVDVVDAMPGVRRSELRELPSVVSVPTAGNQGETPGASLLCELKAVEPGYPYYGDVETDPAGALADLLEAETVLVGPELLSRLGLAVGGRLRVGEAIFSIAGTINREPDRLGVSFTLGPRVMLSMAGLARTGLTGAGSRVVSRLLVRLPDGTTAEEVKAAAIAIREVNPEPEFVRIQTYAEAQPSLRGGLDRTAKFLGLVALLSLLVGGIGVAQAVCAWIAGRLDAIATLRALGVRPREVFTLYLGQTVVLALIGSSIGALLGALVARFVPGFLESLLPVQVDVGWPVAAMVRGIALGVGVAALFGLRPLLDVLRVPPVRVMRADAEPLPMNRWGALAVSGVLVAGIALTATVQSGSVLLGSQFAVGLVVATAVLAAGVWLVVRMVGRTPRDLGPPTLRHGLAALARPSAGTLGAVVALGLGVLTVLGMYLVQDRLTAQLDAELPDEAPTVFLIDIQPDQWDGVRAAMEEAGAENIDSVEVVVGRLRSIAGAPVADLVEQRASGEDEGHRRWVLTREQRLTTMKELPIGNTIVAGALWSVPDRAEISIERDFAADLGANVGDMIAFDIQGVPLELYVSSIRTVEWQRFSINFFLVVEPGVLDDAPRFRVAAARLPEQAERPVQDRLAAAYPNVTMLRLREVLDKVVAILQQVGLGIRLLGSFTVLAGVAILGGSVSAGAVRRAREVALYKTLGMTRFQVIATLAVEYALIGLVAGTIGAAGGVILAWIITRFGFEIAWDWSPGIYLLSVVTAVALTVIAGLAASVRPLTVRPIAVLRQH